jgi:hypothetical protein
MKTMLAVSLLALLASGPIHADCVVPDGTVVIPDGATATKEEMITAHKAVMAFDAAVKAYSDCLAQKLTDKIAAGDDVSKLPQAYATLNDTQVERAQLLAEKFNTELKAYNAANPPH